MKQKNFAKRYYAMFPYPLNLINELSDFRGLSPLEDNRLTPDQLTGVEYVISLLDNTQRTAIYARYKERWTLDEISAHTGISKGTTKAHIDRALRFLRHPAQFKYIRYGYIGAQVMFSTSSIMREVQQ